MDCGFEVFVLVGVLSKLTNCLDGRAFASVLPSKDDCGVLSVTALDLDVIGFCFLYCCRYFLPYIAA